MVFAVRLYAGVDHVYAFWYAAATMLKMRLQRIGRKNNPAYRVVVTDSRNAAKRGRNVDVIGSYNPKLGVVEIDALKAKHWIQHGVQTSGTVHNMLVSKKIIEGKKINVLSRKSPIVDEAALKAKVEAEAKAALEAKKAEEVVVDDTPLVAAEEVKTEEDAEKVAA